MAAAVLELEIPAAGLAHWVTKQGEDTWWMVDGDPRLMRKLSLPCPGDELAAELRRIGGSLIVVPPTWTQPENPPPNWDTLDSFVGPLEDGSRSLQLRWTDDPHDWLLIEDLQATASGRRDTATVDEAA